jgi:hypothetical protein
MGRMDEMGKRMDELERSIGGLMNQAGLEPPNGVAPRGSASAAAALSKPKSISERTASFEI